LRDEGDGPWKADEELNVGQKVHPVGFRIGVTEDWRSHWYPPSKKDFGECLVEDFRIRKYIDAKLNRQPPYAAIAKIVIRRTRNEVEVVLHTARPGLVIGPKGAEVEKLREALEELVDRKVKVTIQEISSPDTNAQLLAESVAEQLRKRAGFRRAMKQRIEAAMQAGAKGCKVQCSGRLGGAEMARRETQLRGSIPLHTLQAHVDYGFAISRTAYGVIGVKVWVYSGNYGEEAAMTSQEPRRGRRGKRG
jgi:small subunit ribosomal protein S3